MKNHVINSTRPQLLDDVLQYLVDLEREGVRPHEAQSRLRRLRQRYPGTEMDLVWEEESFNSFVHYDTLLHLPSEGTISLSFCQDNALPWPLRGVHRWSEGDLVRVNNTVLGVDQAIACLDFIWDEARLVDRLVNVCLIQETLDEEPIELSDEELQRAMDGFRRAHRLYTVADTLDWMERHGMGHEQLEEYVADQAKVALLRTRIAEGQVASYFDAHRADFDQATIARIDFDDEESAQRAYAQINNGEIDFYAAAEERLLAGRAAESQAPARFTRIRRGEEPAQLAAAVLEAPVGAVLAPLATEGGYALVRVLAVEPASLDAVTRRAVEQILFDEWLSARRQAATIEWYWGNAARTDQVA